MRANIISARVESAPPRASFISARVTGPKGADGAAGTPASAFNLGELADITLSSLLDGDSIFRSGSQWLNLPAYTKAQVDAALDELAADYAAQSLWAGGPTLASLDSAADVRTALSVPAVSEVLPLHTSNAVTAVWNYYGFLRANVNSVGLEIGWAYPSIEDSRSSLRFGQGALSDGSSFKGWLQAISSTALQYRASYSDLVSADFGVNADGRAEIRPSGSGLDVYGGLSPSLQMVESADGRSARIGYSADIGMYLLDGGPQAAVNIRTTSVGNPTLWLTQDFSYRARLQYLHEDASLTLANLAGGELRLASGNALIRLNPTGIGLNGYAPVAQSAAIADATDAATAITQLNILLAYLRTRGDIAT